MKTRYSQFLLVIRTSISQYIRHQSQALSERLAQTSPRTIRISLLLILVQVMSTASMATYLQEARLHLMYVRIWQLEATVSGSLLQVLNQARQRHPSLQQLLPVCPLTVIIHGTIRGMSANPMLSTTYTSTVQSSRPCISSLETMNGHRHTGQTRTMPLYLQAIHCRHQVSQILRNQASTPLSFG